MSAADKSKLDGIATGANKYTLPTASSSTLGGVKTTSTVTSTSGLTACPIISGVPYYKDTNTTYSLSSFGVTATAAELNALDGITATVTELNYTDGVTSNIQTQLDGKAASSHNHSASNITSGTLAIARGGTGASNGATGLANLFAAGQTVLSSNQYGTEYPANPVDGQWFLKESTGGIDELSNELISELMLQAYPVGSIYMSFLETSPAEMWGGTWEQIKDQFILAAGDTYAVNGIGGEALHRLTIDEMPSHTHSAVYTHNSATGTPEFGWLSTTSGNNLDYTEAYKGGNAAHNNMPPYTTAYMWQRVA